MAEIIKFKDGDVRVGISLDHIVTYEYVEKKGEEPTLKIDFAAPSLNVLNMPGGSLYQKFYEGKLARQIYKYLDKIALGVSPTRDDS